ncbi:ROK family protein [Testudinibacter sp. TR-2022]|uniref:ROK family protein n=1 Tax=Testudinibacter sp. TR-2022 TaxID=2585029 RepID=UPI0011198384|nr:ROK family protein [Testudinibacter sp. TR-2022]TNH03898.1 ROK family protein [Pasteurellaceae bacterium Phil31]TNH06247.1 ROK family protein [Testudinibacter sp. TR-2022]TNH08898.1 ROK family protein [Testudinibacter sp. TR-2022]TNH13299.1 ROK family protein [Testudinibacter sp. TR-2022]TNH18104.1 ROK family protein [Testudinibacter sp. TR-2022]
MPKIKQDGANRVNLQHLGSVYRLIEQFELISRIDLSKISGFAPASITNLTRELIHSHFVIERAVQNTIVRGRPAVGICLSPFYWQYLAVTLSEKSLDISLCELNGKQLRQQLYSLDKTLPLESFISRGISYFLQQNSDITQHILACSLCILGRIDKFEKRVYLGTEELNPDLQEVLQSEFKFPIIVAEHFAMWTFAESHLGNAINSNNVIFLQFDDAINISVLSEGKMIKNEKQKRMNIDNVTLPKLSELSDKIAQDVPEMERHYLYNQVSNKAIYQLVDLLLPNQLPNDESKIQFLCEQAQQNQPDAITIIHHLADNVSYLLMYLTNIFASEKIMINTRLLSVKEIFLQRLADKLQDALLSDEQQVEIITSKFSWNDPTIASSAIKQQLYSGELFSEHIR